MGSLMYNNSKGNELCRRMCIECLFFVICLRSKLEGVSGYQYFISASDLSSYRSSIATRDICNFKIKHGIQCPFPCTTCST